MSVTRLSIACVTLAAVISSQDAPATKPSPAPRTPQHDLKVSTVSPWTPAATRRLTRSFARRAKPVDAVGTSLDSFLAAEGIVWDAPEQGSLWLAHARYKAGFANGIATFIPFLGSAAERNHDVAFQLVDAELAGHRIELRSAAAPERAGDGVEFDHGAVVARYEPHADGLEQIFRFDELAARGAITLRVRVETELAARESPATIRFSGPSGVVDYGRAFAIDAGGRRLSIDRHLRGGTIEITVPAAFVESCELPLTIDPLVRGTSTLVDTNTRSWGNTDVTYDDSADRYTVCAELIFSATDSDVYSWQIDALGAVVSGSFIAIDSSSASWQSPRIANNAMADRNLVVAQVSQNNASPFSIRGRTRAGGATTTGSPFTISNPSSTSAGDKIRPDVGGDPHLTPPTYFTVVWERVLNPNDHDIHARQVTAAQDPTLLGATEILIDNSGAFETNPQISNGAGAPVPSAQRQKWMIVYERVTTAEVRGRAMRWDGVLDPGSVIAGGVSLRNSPSVSTVTLPGARSSEYLHLVAWEQGTLTDGGDTNDIEVVLCNQSGLVVSPIYNLHTLENAGMAGDWNQVLPRVASDGCRFVVSYQEDYFNSGDIDVRATTLHPMRLGPGSYTLGVTEARAWPASTSQVESGHAICCEFESLGSSSANSAPRSSRYGIAWASANGDVRFNRYDGVSAAGGFSMVPTGCGPVTISASGVPAIGNEITITSSGQRIMVGSPEPIPVPVCGACLLGVAPFGALAPTVSLPIPCDAGVIGLTLAFQSARIGVGPPCLGGTISFSDTVVIDVR